MDLHVIEELARQFEVLLLALTLVSSRMLAAFSIIPLFIGNTVPRYIRAVFVMGLSMGLLPLVLADKSLATMPWADVALYAAKETAIGLVLGMIGSTGFWAVYCAGRIIENQAGLEVAHTVDPLTGRNDSLVGGLFMQLFTIIFLMTGGLFSLIGMLFRSYAVWPITSIAPVVGNFKLFEAVLRSFDELLDLAIKVAAPFVILMLVVEVAFGLLSRFAPQLNVFFLSLPMKVLILALLLLLYSIVMVNSVPSLSVTNFPHLLDSLRGVFRE